MLTMRVRYDSCCAKVQKNGQHSKFQIGSERKAPNSWNRAHSMLLFVNSNSDDCHIQSLL